MTKQPIFGIENENEYGSASGLMAWPDWPWPLRFSDIYATGQTDVFAKNNTALCVHCMPMHDKKIIHVGFRCGRNKKSKKYSFRLHCRRCQQNVEVQFRGFSAVDARLKAV